MAGRDDACEVSRGMDGAVEKRSSKVWIESPQEYKREGKDLAANRECGKSGVRWTMKGTRAGAGIGCRFLDCRTHCILGSVFCKTGVIYTSQGRCGD